MAKRKVMVTSLVLDVRLQCRAQLSSEVIEEYRELIDANPKVWPFREPVRIVEVGERLYVVDGFKRSHAAISAGISHVEADVTPGDWELAVRLACQANATHGERRTRADKRRAVEIALAELKGQSDSQIAKACVVSPTFVATVREAVGAPRTEKVTGADGKSYPASKPKAAAGPKAEAKPAKPRPAVPPPPAPEIKQDGVACSCGETSWVQTREGLQCAVCTRLHPNTPPAPQDAADATPGPQAATLKSIDDARTQFGRLVRSLGKLGQPRGYFEPALEELNRLINAVPGAAEHALEATGKKDPRAA